MAVASFKTLLVAIRDPAKPHRALLAKAASLAGAAPCRIELFHALGEAAARPRAARGRQVDLRAATLERARGRLARLAASRALVASGAKILVRAQWGAPAHAAIVRRARGLGADLVVSEHRPHGKAERLLAANTDRQLLRHCPSPVLLVKPRGGAYRRPVILAAVDPFHANEPATLPRRVTDYAAALARRLGGVVHLFHAFRPLEAVMPVASIPGEPLWVPPRGEREHETEVRQVFERLATDAGIPLQHCHLHMGSVGGGLAAVVERLRARILVIGAVPHTGLGRLLIGNTAERVLERLGCDALIIKPRRFEPR
jgi:universal stress protein E